VTSWSHWRRGRFWAEIVLAVVAGVAAFVAAALVSTAARSHLSAVLLGPLLLLAVLAIARYAGILYALPAGVVTILAFDWYFLPPLRNLDAATVGAADRIRACSLNRRERQGGAGFQHGRSLAARSGRNERGV
jgi:K+-sensing histidine kinase KdpD